MSYLLNLPANSINERDGETLDFIPRNTSEAWGVVWSEGSIDAVLPIDDAYELASDLRLRDCHAVGVERFDSEKEAIEHADCF